MHLRSTIEVHPLLLKTSQRVSNSTPVPCDANNQPFELSSVDEHTSHSPGDISITSGLGSSSRSVGSKDDSDSDKELPNFSLFPPQSSTTRAEEMSKDTFNRELYEANVTKHLREHLNVILGGEKCDGDNLTADGNACAKDDRLAFQDNQHGLYKEGGLDSNGGSNGPGANGFPNVQVPTMCTQTSEVINDGNGRSHKNGTRIMQSKSRLKGKVSASQ